MARAITQWLRGHGFLKLGGLPSNTRSVFLVNTMQSYSWLYGSVIMETVSSRRRLVGVQRQEDPRTVAVAVAVAELCRVG